jgi:hypothetical protein
VGFAVVDFVSLGGAIAATKVSEIAIYEGPSALRKQPDRFARNTAAVVWEPVGNP